MNLIWVTAVSIFPGLVWLYFFYKQDKYEPEPKRLVLLSFFYGGLAVVPVGIIEFPFSNLIEDPPNLAVLLLVSIFIIGLGEEIIKFGVVRYTIYKDEEFNEVMDGIIYSISVGLGFAAAENFLYTAVFGFQVGLNRAFITTLLHASFSGVMGYYLGKFKFESDPKLIRNGLIQVVLAHGIYDFLVIGRLIPVVLVYLIVIGFYLYLGKLIKLSLSTSPFRSD